MTDNDPDMLIVGQLQAAERYYNDLGDLTRGSLMYGAWREIERIRDENQRMRPIVVAVLAMKSPDGFDPSTVGAVMAAVGEYEQGEHL